MPGKSKRPRDVNALAAQIVDEATKGTKVTAKVSGRRRSGQAGGKARAEALSAEQRRAIAQKAAAARWRKAQG